MISRKCVNLFVRLWICVKKAIPLISSYKLRFLWPLAVIAAGAKEIMSYFIEVLDRQKIDALVTQTGCMGYCYAEPTIEIKLPGQEPLVFGYVDKAKVEEIIDKYIRKGILVDGIIPVTYTTVKPE